jgi:hypothetical protein
MLRFGFIGLLLFPAGWLFFVLGLIGEELEPLLLGIGAVSVFVGTASLRSARAALKRLRAISRA